MNRCLTACLLWAMLSGCDYIQSNADTEKQRAEVAQKRQQDIEVLIARLSGDKMTGHLDSFDECFRFRKPNLDAIWRVVVRLVGSRNFGFSTSDGQKRVGMRVDIRYLHDLCDIATEDCRLAYESLIEHELYGEKIAAKREYDGCLEYIRARREAFILQQEILKHQMNAIRLVRKAIVFYERNKERVVYLNESISYSDEMLNKEWSLILFELEGESLYYPYRYNLYGGLNTEKALSDALERCNVRLKKAKREGLEK